jgi:hypothetical protein
VEHEAEEERLSLWEKNVDIFLFVRRLPHSPHSAPASASENERIISKLFWQSWQIYS